MVTWASAQAVIGLLYELFCAKQGATSVNATNRLGLAENDQL
jgi:hypothetical protein